ncbi:VWA domain-containing protein [Methylovulum psychrotolerans]|uniref:VWA domain-containing protein n=1 Tax=Methylovulum psychrotolerans TaxID=1704499 RepID=A0A2S5CHJ8_9GAMM|nr:VWA domain-containing protein [Methylovulum psychrotolerans]POZ50293.1 VWA domain-containing protein [Methylovulum psychrotolerans]
MNLLRTAFLTGCFGLLLLVAACGKPTEPKTATNTLTLLAGSELKDLEPMWANLQEQTGIHLQITYTGTLDGAEILSDPKQHYDLAWFSHAKYLTLMQEKQKLIQAQEKIAISPVIPAIKESLAKKWGWLDHPQVTWTQLAEKIRSGQLTYAMTDPAASNSGFSTVMSVQAALANKGDALTAQDVDAEKLKSFFSGHVLTAGSSGFLSSLFLRNQAQVGGIFNYEAELLKLNRNPLLQEKLVLLYPQEGTVIADYPLLLLAKDQAANYQKLVDYLKSAAFQQWLMDTTDRRPVNPAVALGTQFPKGYLLDMPFPNTIATVNEILFAYLNEQRQPSHTYFVLDVSGSMAGSGIAALQQAMANLAGADTTLTGKFARFRNREQVTLITFNHQVQDIRHFTVDKEGHALQDIDAYVNGLTTTGGTAIFSALDVAYKQATQARAADPKRFYSIVLMTDGLNEDGMSYTDFVRLYQQHANSAAAINTFPIIFGNADPSQLQALAALTGGQVFDSRTNSLAAAFKQIRGYQ